MQKTKGFSWFLLTLFKSMILVAVVSGLVIDLFNGNGLEFWTWLGRPVTEMRIWELVMIVMVVSILNE